MVGYGVGVLLLSTVAGYWVLERAEGHKGSLRKVGRFLGWLIIVSSLIGVVCRVWCYATCDPGPMGKGWCPFKKPMTSMEAPAKP